MHVHGLWVRSIATRLSIMNTHHLDKKHGFAMVLGTGRGFFTNYSFSHSIFHFYTVWLCSIQFSKLEMF